MAKSRGTCLYREARLNLEPAYPGSTIAVTLPAHETSTFGTRVQPKRTIVTDQYPERDEDGFEKRHLASDGGMYFRKHHSYPRSFLWRLLDGRKTLEIRATDLDQDATSELEANITFVLHFASPIRPFCLAFADPADRNALTVFAITSANELYTLTLHRDFFMRHAASEMEIGDWCRRTSFSVFTFRVPYRMAAVNNNELLISLDDGGILYAKRSHNDAIWEESVYQESSWAGSVRGLIKWGGEQKVRFENVDLAPSAAAAVALSPAREPSSGPMHILTVCLNHKLRVWNVATGACTIQMDLLGDPESPAHKSAYTMGTRQPNLMTVVNIEGGVDGAEYHIVTYSPKQHQLKFWGVRDADEADNGIFDVRSDFEFVPPIDELMDSNAWTLEEFHIRPGPSGWKGAELWIRARAGPSSRVFSLKFDLKADLSKLEKTWKNDWSSVDPGPLSVERLKQNPANPGEQELDASDLFETDITERWLSFLFFPGRFTTATLEAALLVFRRGLKGAKTPAASKGTLKERLCAVVDAFAALDRDGAVTQARYQETLAAQWQAYWSLVKDLHKSRGQYLSLSFDYAEGMPWLVLSDYLSAIRLVSNLEAIPLNSSVISSSAAISGPMGRSLRRKDEREVAKLLNAAASFRKCLPEDIHSRLLKEVDGEILDSRSLAVVDRMDLMERNCDLSQQVAEEDVATLVEELGMSVKELTTDIFQRAIAELGQTEEGQEFKNRQVTAFGLNALVRVSQEVLDLSTNVLLDLLVLVLFLYYEEESSDDFDAPELFVDIIKLLKDMAVLSWEASTLWSHQSPSGNASRALLNSMAETQKGGKFPMTQTVLEGLLGHRAFHHHMPKGLGTQFLTYWSRVWLGQDDNDRAFDPANEDIMSILLVQKEYGLALEFSKYLPVSNWATYLKGRMYIALGDNESASLCFQKAAYNLALGQFNIDDADRTNLISAEQGDSFSNGLPRYYDHVLSLFEKAKAYPYVADFARLGLRCLRGNEDEQLRTDLLSRLFNASIQTARFDDAYSAMTRHTNVPFRTSALQTLTTTLISHNQTAKLLSYPFLNLSNELDTILYTLATRALSITPKSGPQYHLVLYAYRLKRNNYRGAAAILYDRLQRLKSSSESRVVDEEGGILDTYRMIINTLACVGKQDAYILAEPGVIGTTLGLSGLNLGSSRSSLGGSRTSLGGSGSGGSSGPAKKLDFGLGQAKQLLKRRIVTLDDLRREYAAELDRVDMVEKGTYPFVVAGDEMDIL